MRDILKTSRFRNRRSKSRKARIFTATGRLVLALLILLVVTIPWGIKVYRLKRAPYPEYKQSDMNGAIRHSARQTERHL